LSSPTRVSAARSSEPGQAGAATGEAAGEAAGEPAGAATGDAGTAAVGELSGCAVVGDGVDTCAGAHEVRSTALSMISEHAPRLSRSTCNGD
jgi:hypothetical protein